MQMISLKEASHLRSFSVIPGVFLESRSMRTCRFMLTLLAQLAESQDNVAIVVYIKPFYIYASTIYRLTSQSRSETVLIDLVEW